MDVFNQKKQDRREAYDDYAKRVKGCKHLIPPPFESLTCHRCDVCLTCDWAWDPYNTDGDCIADK